MPRSPFMLALLLFTGDVTLPFPIAAQEKDEDECLRLRPAIRSPVEMARCTSDLDGSELALQRAYSALRRRAGSEALPDLEKAQKAWITFRDAECEYSAGGSGTGHSSAVIACMADMNRAKAKELESDRERWTD